MAPGADSASQERPLDLKTYQISYRWMDRHYTTVMPHFTAYNALSAAEIMLMVGAKPYAIAEVPNGR